MGFGFVERRGFFFIFCSRGLLFRFFWFLDSVGSRI